MPTQRWWMLLPLMYVYEVLLRLRESAWNMCRRLHPAKLYCFDMRSLSTSDILLESVPRHALAIWPALNVTATNENRKAS